jgi:hypothetical protein
LSYEVGIWHALVKLTCFKISQSIDGKRYLFFSGGIGLYWRGENTHPELSGKINPKIKIHSWHFWFVRKTQYFTPSLLWIGSSNTQPLKIFINVFIRHENLLLARFVD